MLGHFVENVGQSVACLGDRESVNAWLLLPNRFLMQAIWTSTGGEIDTAYCKLGNLIHLWRKAPMSIEIICPTCRKSYRVKDELAGKTAKCGCGTRISIPAPPEASQLEDLLSELPATTSDPLFASAEVGQPAPGFSNQATLAGNAALPNRKRDDWLKSVGIKLGQIVVGAGVAGALAYRSLSRDQKLRQMELSTKIAIIAGVAVIGALLGAALTFAEMLRARHNSGKHVPAPVLWLFANGWKTAVLWIFLAFAGAFLYVCFLAMTV